MFLALLLGFVVLLVVWIYYKFKQAGKYWPGHGIFQVKQKNFLKVLLLGEFDFIPAELDTYGQVKAKQLRLGGFLEFWSPGLYITDLDLLKQIFIKDFDHFVNRRSLDVKKTDPHSYYSIVNQTDEEWKDLRIKMSPTFTTGKIRRMFDIFDSSSKKLQKALELELLEETGSSSSSNNIEMSPMISKFTMDVIASAAFGIETNAFEETDSLFGRMAKKLSFQFNLKLILKVIMVSIFPRLFELLGLKIADEEADKFFSKIITDNLNHRQMTGEKREDFLQIMLEAKLGTLKKEEESELDAFEKNAQLSDADKPLRSHIEFTDDVIIAQCLLFFIAGVDNIESHVTFTLYELALNPGVQARLHKELLEATEDTSGELNYDLVNNLEYLDMVISETLRKYPPGFRSERKCTRSYKIPGTDYVLPEGSIVALPIYAVHHDPDIWPEPEKFEPERFTKENVSKRHTCAYSPFGHGPRNCIAKRFALVEAKVAIARLVLDFEFEPCEKTVIPVKFAKKSPLKPTDNTCLAVKRRQS